MIEIQFEPITEWPDKDTPDRRGNRFRTPYDKTLRQLRYELDQLDAEAVAIQIVTLNGRADLRRDGMLAARAQIDHPGVRISFDSKFGPLTYATDAFESRYYSDPPGWQINLRAITLGLEALRRIDDYGITRTGEQYRGWQQIAARTGSGSGMSLDIALSVLAEESGYARDTVEGRQHWPDALRAAKKHAHPDSNKGDRRRWDALEQAAATLGLDF